jgi:serine/threonine-protein kinase
MSDPKTGNLLEGAPEIEGYIILEQLGCGGSSIVYKAHQISLDRPVVIKMLSPALSIEPDDVAQFKKEAHIAARLKHHSITQVYDFGEAPGGRYYFVMEYISGYTVGQWLRKKGQLAEVDLLIIAHSVAEALQYAWESNGVIHCDIKPENLMVDGDGTLKIMDLGLARVVKKVQKTETEHVDEQVIVGTPNYMSPEQIRGEPDLDQRTDIYSLGLTLYHLASGILPYEHPDPNVVMEKQLTEILPDIRIHNKKISEGFSSLIKQMIIKDRKKRLTQWAEVLTKLSTIEKEISAREQATLSQTQQIAIEKPKEAEQTSEKHGAETAKKGSKDQKNCPFCGELIKRKAIYCRFCKKALPPDKKGMLDPESPLKLKLKASTVVARTSQSKARRVSPHQKPIIVVKEAEQKQSGLGCLLRLLISVVLTAFIIFYAIFKFGSNIDILVPIKNQLVEVILPAIIETPAKVLDWIRSGGKSEKKDDDEEETAPRHKAVIVRTHRGEAVETYDVPAGKEPEKEKPSSSVIYDKSDAYSHAAVESTYSEVEKAKSEDKTTTEESPENQNVSEAVITSTRSADLQSEEYQRQLESFKQQVPRPGERISITLKNNPQPLRGVLKEIKADGVMIQNDKVMAFYKFNLMTDESRLPFFPAERAKAALKQSK